jgi:SAM-dependent methyltransferase
MELFGPHGRTRVLLRTWRANMLVAASRAVGKDIAAGYLGNVPQLADYIGAYQSRAEQGRTVDPTVTVCDHRDWRTHFAAQLHGRGLELGALHRPIPTHPGMEMTYLDYASHDELRQRYPDLATKIVDVHVVDDAETLATVADASFDFLNSAHVIEHMRDPIGALVQWLRVIRDGGLLYLVVPDKRRSFDERRVRTTLAHLVLDHQQPSAERDFEHFLDYAVFVHHADIDQAIPEATRLRDTDFSIHFHVFLPQDIVRLVEWVDTHVAPVSIVEGPVLSPAVDEFHLLLRKGVRT